MTNAEIIQKLIKARQRLARGWCQDVARLNDNVCLFASLWVRTGEVSHYGDLQVIWALARAIKPVLNPDPYAPMGAASILVLWNDEPGRTQEEVLDLVDQAIASVMKLGTAQEAKPREELVEA